jgi:hypothetical protein
MATVITVTNGGGSEHPVIVSDGTNSTRLVPGSESVSITVPDAGQLQVTVSPDAVTGMMAAAEAAPADADSKHADKPYSSSRHR